MDRRRLSLFLLGSTVLSACGGGGGSTTVPPEAAGQGDAALASAASQRAVAAWGDSHTAGYGGSPGAVGYAEILAGLAPGRQVFNGGVAGETSTQIADRQVRDVAHRGWTSVFWYGGNNQWDPDTIAIDLSRSIGTLAAGNDRYLVLSVLNQAAPDERRGGWLYERIIGLNERLARTWGDRYLDVRRLLVQSARMDDARDRNDQADDVPPMSLRADGVHLNEAGYAIVARAVLQALDARGW